MTTSELDSVSRRHQEWLVEIEQWRAWIGVWQEQMSCYLPQLERAVDTHLERLHKHAESLNALQTSIAEREETLKSGSHRTDLLPLMLEMDASWHARERARHEQFKAAYQCLMQALVLLRGEPILD